MTEVIKLDSEKTYAAILKAARKRQFLSYGEIAAASNIPWAKARRLVPQHLGQLVTVAHERGWPLPSAIVVNRDDVATGQLQGSALAGFLAAAKDVGYDVTVPESFVREQQEKVFEWAMTAPECLGQQASIDSIDKKSHNEGPRFVSYFGPVLDALRAFGGQAKPKDVYDWILANIDVPESEVKGINKSGQSKFYNRVAWARFYLFKAGLLSNSQRGLWVLTSEGRETELDDLAKALAIFKDVQSRIRINEDEEDPAPDATNAAAGLFDDPSRQFWFAGAAWDEGDQLDRFRKEGIWQNGYEDKFSDLVEKMNPGDQIAIKSSFVQKYNLPFDVGGKPVSCMRIKATGTVIENLGDRQTVRVEWDPQSKSRDWYFYTYRTTLVKTDPDDELARRLILFTFTGADQDYDFWKKVPYFAQKYTSASDETSTIDAYVLDADGTDTSDKVPAAPPYSIDTIIEEGCFLTRDELESALSRLKEKKNLILQGPPGTGKTWLAKRLGYALIGSKAGRSRLRIVQFHPSLSYEDFVRGWRPQGDGNLKLTDGVFLKAVQAAISEPDLPHVFIIEEINRGNPAQVFGEILTLLENSKRRADEAIELAYQNEDEFSRVHIPDNLFVIGTMNIADRSLALVDLALRRRFAFMTLKPQLGESWRDWCQKKGFDNDTISLIEERISTLNDEIKNDRSLGVQYQIGHSYVTPLDKTYNARGWFRQVIETEIAPLLEEYWFDANHKAQEAKSRLLAGLE